MTNDDPGAPVTDETRESGARNRSPFTWLVAGAVVLIVLVLVVLGLMNRADDSEVLSADAPSPSPTPEVTELTAGAVSGRCLPPSAGLLRNQSLAFDGTVEGVTRETVRLLATKFYTGDASDVVEVTAPAAELQLLIGAVDFQEGERYLVSATDGRVSVCGLSGPHTARLADLYDEAFGG